MARGVLVQALCKRKLERRISEEWSWLVHRCCLVVLEEQLVLNEASGNENQTKLTLLD